MENEYGSYSACDHLYTRHLRDEFIKHLGKEVLLFTTDGDGVNYLNCGTVDGVYATVDFGSGERNKFFLNPFRGEFFWFYEVQRVDIFFENGRKLTSLVIGLYWTQHLN